MGHNRYGYLPKSKIWREIVNSLGGYTSGTTEISAVAKSTFRQLQSQYSNLKNDYSINAGFEFLVQVSLAFQQNSPIKYLTEREYLIKKSCNSSRF